MAKNVTAALSLVCLLIAPSLAVGGDVYTPRPGTSERSQIISAARATIARELNEPFELLVSRLSVQGDWAFVAATPQQPNGRPYDYTGTRYQAMIEEGAFDDWLCALLRRGEGRWDVVALEIGATDVPYAGWSEQYQAPSAIFP
jgi:hypothetical protein